MSFGTNPWKSTFLFLSFGRANPSIWSGNMKNLHLTGKILQDWGCKLIPGANSSISLHKNLSILQSSILLAEFHEFSHGIFRFIFSRRLISKPTISFHYLLSLVCQEVGHSWSLGFVPRIFITHLLSQHFQWITNSLCVSRFTYRL